MEYQNPAFQWWKVILGIIGAVLLASISYKINAPTSKDNYAAGSQPTTNDTKNYGLVVGPIFGGCASTTSAIKPEVKK